MLQLKRSHWTLAQLQAKWPHLRWLEPLSISVAGQPPVLVCRICIANVGFRATDARLWPRELLGFQEHLRKQHGIESYGKN